MRATPHLDDGLPGTPAPGRATFHAPRPDRTWLEIDVDALARNWNRVKSVFTGARVGAVVKSDAYGLGIDAVVPELASWGCRDFWVTHPDEGLQVRRHVAELDSRVFVLHGLCRWPAVELARHGLIPVLANREELVLAQTGARGAGRPLPVAVHLDTGLGRIGLRAADVAALRANPEPLGDLNLVCWVTQLGRFDEPESPECQAQRQRFVDWTGHGLPAAERSLATSSCVFAARDWHFDHARVGSALFGIDTTPARPQGLACTATLRAPVLDVFETPAGAEVGYGSQFRTARPSRLATLAIGYGDGLPFSLANRGHLLLRGRPAPIVGGISMSMTTVDVTDLDAEVRPGDWAEVFGAGQPLAELARTAGMTPNAMLVPAASHARRTLRDARSSMGAPSGAVSWA